MIDMWERAWRASHTQEEWRWLAAEAERRGQALSAVAGLIRSTYPVGAPTPLSVAAVAVSADVGEAAS